MKITIGNSAEIIEKAQAIRYQVFSVEQKIPRELDLDGLDEISVHVLVIVEEVAVATARLTINDDGSSVMARVAVMKACRGLGIASKVIESLIDYVQSIETNSITIHAHKYLQEYYQQFGFYFIRDVEIVGEHQLIEMKRLTK